MQRYMQHAAVSLASIAACIAAPLAAQDADGSVVEDIAPAVEPDPALQAAQTALEIAPVFDGHNDIPIQLRRRFDNQINNFDFIDTLDTGPEVDGNPLQTDLNRLREGHVGAQFWSVYVPPSLPEPEAVQMTLEQIDVMKRLIGLYPDALAFAETADDVERAIAEGRIASLLGMEGGHSIGSSLAVLRQMYAVGARYMTLTHGLNTPWADSATDDPEHGGLTEFGKDVVREMNRIGMLVDLSHVSEEAMHDALDVASAPVIFSHSGVRAVNGHARNVPDSVLQRLPENGGIVMIVGLPGYLNDDQRQWFAQREAEVARQESLFRGQPDVVSRAMAEWDAGNPMPDATISDMADHIDYVRDLIGVEYVGIGGDFDGMPTGPVGFEDVRGYPQLFAELVRRGYSQVELELIASRNALRVLREAERQAASEADAMPIETLIPSTQP